MILRSQFKIFLLFMYSLNGVFRGMNRLLRLTKTIVNAVKGHGPKRGHHDHKRFGGGHVGFLLR